mgnify:CR=1 FL=1
MSMMSVFGVFLFFFMIVGAIILAVVITMSSRSRNTETSIEEQASYYKTKNTGYEKPSNLPWVMVGVLAILFVVGFFYGSNKINSYENQVTNLQSNVSQQHSELWSLRSQVNILNGELRNLQEEESYVQRGAYNLVSVTNEGTGIVDVEIFMNRLPVGEDITLVIEDQAGNHEEIVMMSDTMTFQTSLELDLEGNYTIYVMVEADGEYIKEEIRPLNMVHLIGGRMGVEVNEDWDQDGIVVMFEVYSNYELNPNMALENVRFEVYYDDVLYTAHLYSTPTSNNGLTQIFYHEVHIAHEEEARVTIKIIGEDGFGNSHVLFEEGWWN